MQPLVSIVTPSYNQAAFLEQTILSVLNQTYPRLEYIIVDGGSSDHSVEIIRKYAHRLVYWHSQKDGGPAEAIRHGFQKATGGILAWLNSDDVLAENAVEKATQALLRHPEALMTYGNRVAIDEAGRLLYYRPSLPWLSRSPHISTILPQETCFWRREAYEAVGGLDCDLKFAFDYYLFSKIARRGAIVYASDLWGFFRKHGASKTMLTFSTVGLREGLAVQEQIWRKRVSPLASKTVQTMVRLYALGRSACIKKPAWPRCLPPLTKASLVERCIKSLHEGSRWKKLLVQLSRRKKS